MRSAQGVAAGVAILMVTAALTAALVSSPEPAYAAASPASQPHETVLVDCAGHHTRTPRQILACADGSITVDHLRWTTWGGVVATARGRAEVNTCSPNCAAGHEVAYAVLLRLDHRTRPGASRRYTQIHLHFLQQRPAWLHSRNLTLPVPS